jgi:hypothetical protein
MKRNRFLFRPGSLTVGALCLAGALVRGQTSTPTPQEPPSAATTADTGAASSVVGKWRSNAAASVQYKNSYTGALAPTSGHSFFYEFLPDHTYCYNGLLQVTT